MLDANEVRFGADNFGITLTDIYQETGPFSSGGVEVSAGPYYWCKVEVVLCGRGHLLDREPDMINIVDWWATDVIEALETPLPQSAVNADTASIAAYLLFEFRRTWRDMPRRCLRLILRDVPTIAKDAYVAFKDLKVIDPMGGQVGDPTPFCYFLCWQPNSWVVAHSADEGFTAVNLDPKELSRVCQDVRTYIRSLEAYRPSPAPEKLTNENLLWRKSKPGSGPDNLV